MKWIEVGTGTGVFVGEYHASGYGRSNCTLVKIAEGLLVLSPASGMSDADFEALDAKGKLVAMVAPHSGHTLGLPDWYKRYPLIPIYAAEKSLERLKKVGKVPVINITQFQTASKELQFTVAPGSGAQTLHMEVDRGDRRVVYADELIMDLDRMPDQAFYFQALFWLFGMRPGKRVNRGYLRFYVKGGKPALKERVLKITEETPAGPPHIIFAHGPVISSRDEYTKVRELLKRV